MFTLLVLLGCRGPDAVPSDDTADANDSAAVSGSDDGSSDDGSGGDGDSAVDESADPDETGLPSAYEYEEPERDSSTFNPDGAQAAVEAFVDVLYTLHVGPVFEGFFATMDYGDGSCPTVRPGSGDDTFWSADNCTAASGAIFDGYIDYTTYDNRQLFYGDDIRYSGAEVHGVGRVTSAEGYVWRLEGEATLVSGTGNSGEQANVSILEGWSSWGDPSVSDSWIYNDVMNPNLRIRTERKGEARELQVEGGVSGLGGVYDAIYLDDIELKNAASGASCSKEPSSAIWLRAAGGEWFQIRFDINEQGIVTGDCDGCGRVVYRLEDVGTFCFDFDTMLDWGELPW
jgi:hypothetical protein